VTTYTTPQLDAAEAVATLLTGRTIAGFTVVARSHVILPKYRLEDLGDIRIDCSVDETHDMLRGTLLGNLFEEECPVLVSVQAQCDAGDGQYHRRLKSLVRGIAAVLALNATIGDRFTSGDVTVDEDYHSLEFEGRFKATVSVLYLVMGSE
jgi:hypothetical protein